MSITFGSAVAPSQVTLNLDALFATTLASYKNTLEDMITESNAVFYEIKNGGMWQTQPGSAYIAEDLMYELGTFDAFDGYDELPDTPTDGLTQVQYEWRQGAAPISYSEKERKQNKHRLVDLVKAKIKQAEMGIIDGFSKHLLQGSLPESGSLVTPYTSPVNGASFINPLPLLIAYDPTTSRTVGNINQYTYSWWRNRQKESAATTYAALLLEMDNMYNTCSRGPGGPPNVIWTDQKTYELINAAYYQQYRTQLQSDGNYPFENVKFRKAHITFDQYMPDVYSAATTCATYGTMYFVNTQFLSMKVEEETNLSMTPFAKPPKGDSRLAHILFMGQLTTNNRRKHGVLGKIARSFS